MLPSVSKITPACTHITELCQQVFIYNEETHWTWHTSRAQVLQLAKSHFGDNQAVITFVLHPFCFYDIWVLCVAWIYIYIYIIYIYIYIYIHIRVIPLCFLSPYNQEGTLFSMLFSDVLIEEVFYRSNPYKNPKKWHGW